MTVLKKVIENSERSFKALGIELRQSEEQKENGDPGTIFGIAAPFEVLSDEDAIPWFREKIRKGAFTKTIMEDEQKAYWMHEKTWLLGSRSAGTLRLEEKEDGLYYEIDLPNTSAGRDVAVSVGRKDIDGVSFSFRAEKQEWDETDPENEIRTIIECRLYEISPEPFPAYSSTSISSRSAKGSYDEYKKIKELNVRDINQKLLDRRKKALDLLELE